MKTAFLFNGQGSQFVGMGADLHGSIIVDKIYAEAKRIAGFCVKDLSVKGPVVELNKTEKTQIAIVTLQIAILEVLKENGIKSDSTAGLSLGEYSALYNAQALTIEEVLHLVKARGKIMAQVAKTIKEPKMIVVLGLDGKETTKIVEKLQDLNNKIAVANYNCPGQQVVAGTKEAIEAFKENAIHAKKLIEIDVSVPSHTPLMEGTTIPFGNTLQEIEFKDLNQDLYANVTGEKISKDNISQNLLKQLTHSTHMEIIIRNMIKDKCVRFVEIGPKKILSSFVRKIAKEEEVQVELINITDNESLNRAIITLKGE